MGCSQDLSGQNMSKAQRKEGWESEPIDSQNVKRFILCIFFVYVCIKLEMYWSGFRNETEYTSEHLR
mgnify:CR=1 FL=1